MSFFGGEWKKIEFNLKGDGVVDVGARSVRLLALGEDGGRSEVAMSADGEGVFLRSKRVNLTGKSHKKRK